MEVCIALAVANIVVALAPPIPWKDLRRRTPTGVDLTGRVQALGARSFSFLMGRWRRALFTVINLLIIVYVLSGGG